ncbi:MAG: murein biosynthesis integral membrane protein MurJ [Planctomycetaceae bacterium]
MDEPEQSSGTSGKLKGLKAVSLLTLLSRITGLARDSLMASVFGAGMVLDAFTLAFRVPNMFRRLFGDGAMAAALLPEFVRTDECEGREAASLLFSGVARKLFYILLAFIVVTEVAVAFVYVSFEISGRMRLLCELSMILMPYSLLICMAGAYSAALNGVHHFKYPALAPVVLNVIWLAGGLYSAVRFTTGPDEVRLISMFILAGGVAQLSMVVYKARQYQIRLSAPTPAATARTAIVFRAMAPVLLGLSVSQVNGLIDSLLAWGLSSGNLDSFPSLDRFRLPIGTAAALYLGQRMFQFPLGVFAVALGTVLFPRFARHAQTNDLAELNKDLLHGLQLVLVVGIPASVGLWFMAAPITDLLFRYGQFDAQAAIMTRNMIAGHGLGVWAFSGLLIVNRVFYASNDQTTPMRQGLMCVGLNILFDFVLLPILGGPALPVANVLATMFQLGLALEVLRSRFLILGREAFVPILWRIGVCTLAMNFAGLGTLYLTSLVEPAFDPIVYRLIKVSLPVMAAVVVYAATLTATGVSLKKLLNEPFF